MCLEQTGSQVSPCIIVTEHNGPMPRWEICPEGGASKKAVFLSSVQWPIQDIVEFQLFIVGEDTAKNLYLNIKTKIYVFYNPSVSRSGLMTLLKRCCHQWCSRTRDRKRILPWRRSFFSPTNYLWVEEEEEPRGMILRRLIQNVLSWWLFTALIGGCSVQFLPLIKNNKLENLKNQYLVGFY